MNPDLSQNVRRAALMLHAMTPQDSAWLLRQMPPLQAAELQSLLEELRALGMPSDPMLLNDLLLGEAVPLDPRGIRPTQDEGANDAGLRDESLETLMRRLDAVRGDLLIPILRAEPVVLLAFLLSLKHWSWADSIWDALETNKRLSLRAQIDVLNLEFPSSSGPAPQQLCEALLRSLLQRCERASDPHSLPSIAPDMKRNGPMQWFRQRLPLWGGTSEPMKAHR